MIIILSPTALTSSSKHHSADKPPVVNGDTVKYRGKIYDLSPLEEGSEIYIGSPFEGAAARINGIINIRLEYFYYKSSATEKQSTDWNDFTFSINSGECPDPITRNQEAAYG